MQGWVVDMLPLYYDHTTGKPYNSTLKRLVWNNTLDALFVTTPRVQQVARQYFNCSEVPGAPVFVPSAATQGSAGSNSHWNYKVLKVG